MAVSTGTASELIDELHLMGRAFRGAVVSDESSILPGGLGVLMALEARGQCRQNELASDLCISQSALSRHVTELVAEGYVARRPDPGDGRATQLLTTSAGRELLSGTRAARAESLQNALDDWDEADAQAASSAFRKLRASLTRYAHRADRPVQSKITVKGI